MILKTEKMISLLSLKIFILKRRMIIMLNNYQNDTTVKVISMLTQAEKVAFKTANEIINVRIDENNGPELELSDNTIIIFESYSQYYSFISNKGEKIYDTVTKVFDVEKMNQLYLQKEDDVVDVIYRNNPIYRVGEYHIDGSPAPIYRFFKVN